jgi:carnitine-CoA ligase
MTHVSPLRVDAAVEALPVLIQERANQQPDRAWLGDVGGDRATYQDAVERGGRWSAALAGLGVREGDRVVTLVPNSVESVLCWFGIANLGAIEAPIHPSFTGYMLEHTINTVAPEVIVAVPSTLERVLAALANLPSVRHVILVGALDAPPPAGVLSALDLLADVPAPAAVAQRHSWDTAAILFTSGTTGPSKGVILPWGAIRCTAQRSFPYTDLVADDVIYVFTPSSHMGAKALPYLAAMIGGQAVMRPDFRIGSFLDDIRTYGITSTPAVGAIPQFLAQTEPRPDDRDIPLRNLLMAPLVPDLEGFRQRFGVRICTAYSMTELAIPFASEGWDVENHRSVGKHVPGWPGVETRLVDTNDMEVPVGEVGELIVRTAEPWTINAGYFGMPEATATAWRNGWFHTGDAFRRDEAGYYYFVDRMKDCIRRRGENVSSFEVETLVNQYEGVTESAAVPAQGDDGNDEVKVFVCGSDSLDPAELIRFLIPRMPRFMVPRYVEVIPELPKTDGTLRVKKQELRARGNSAATWDREAAGIVVPKS